jgi:hypothetical protein
MSGENTADRLAYEHWSGEITRQRARIAEIRANAGIVIAAVSLVASFLGAKTLDRVGSAHGWSDVALVLLPLSIFFSVRALWPVRDPSAKGWAEWCVRRLHSENLVRLSGTQLIWRHTVPAEALDGQSLLSRFAGTLKGYSDENQKLVDRRANNLMAAIVLLLAQAVIWSVSLMGT